MRERSDSAARSAYLIRTDPDEVVKIRGEEVRANLSAKAIKALTSFSKFSMHGTGSRTWQRLLDSAAINCSVLSVIAFMILLSAVAIFL